MARVFYILTRIHKERLRAWVTEDQRLFVKSCSAPTVPQHSEFKMQCQLNHTGVISPRNSRPPTLSDEKLFLSQKATLELCGSRPLHSKLAQPSYASDRRRSPATEMGQGVSCSRSSDEHEFYSAVQSGDLQSVEAALQYEPGLIHRTTIYDRLSALHIAAANGCIEVRSLVLSSGTSLAKPISRHLFGFC